MCSFLIHFQDNLSIAFYVRHFHEKHRPGPTSNVNPAVVNDGCLVGSDNSIKCLKAVLFDQVFLSVHCSLL